MNRERLHHDFEGKLNYMERRSVDLVHQVLNLNSNMYQENKNISDLFMFYGKILSRRTSREFFDSMKKTWDVLNNPRNNLVALKSLKHNCSDSFLIMPLKAYNHMFATVARKIGEDYSFTIVNKGYRMPSRSMYEEYCVPKSKLESLVKAIKEGMGEFPVESFYKEFEKHSTAKYKLNVASRIQKTGNCFVKEPETAIKFAFSTRNFCSSDYMKIRSHDFARAFRPKWGMSTFNMHSLFVKEVIKDNPHAKNYFEEKLQIYQQNKTYHKYLKDGKDNEESFRKAFSTDDKYFESNDKASYIRLLANINVDTIRQYTPQIYEIVKKIGSQELSKSLSALLDISTPEDIDIYFDRRENCQELKRKIDFINKYFPEFASEIKREFHLYYLIKSNGLFENKKDFEKAYLFAKNANDLYPYNARAHFYEGYYAFELAKKAEQERSESTKYCRDMCARAINSFSHSIQLKPDIGDSYLIRGRVYEELGDIEKSNQDYKNASKFGLQIVGHGAIRDKYCLSNILKPSKNQMGTRIHVNL